MSFPRGRLDSGVDASGVPRQFMGLLEARFRWVNVQPPLVEGQRYPRAARRQILTVTGQGHHIISERMALGSFGMDSNDQPVMPCLPSGSMTSDGISGVRRCSGGVGRGGGRHACRAVMVSYAARTFSCRGWRR